MTKRKYYEFPNPTSKVGELIKRRRLQMLIHSCAYYQFDTQFISDDQWQEWANELRDLIKKYPNEYSDRFDQFFDDWTGDTGMHLCLRDPWVYSTTKHFIDHKILECRR